MSEPLSQEVRDRIAAEFPEAVRAEVATALLSYSMTPVDFGRLRILDAARGQVADVARLVDMGNRYGRDWVMHGGQFDKQNTE